MARLDLAHRLNTDIIWIDVVEVVTREPDADIMPCLADETLFRGLRENLGEVQWISLSVKGNIYHYIALGDFIQYCDR